MKATDLRMEHGLETPYPLQPCQNYFRLEGWAIALGADQPTRVRMVIGDQVFPPDQTPEREDVAEKYPQDIYARQTGFEFVCFLPFGNHWGTLQASADGQNWRALRTMLIPVSSHPLMGGFEPMGTGGVVTAPIRAAGWVWHPEFAIREVGLLMGNIEVPLDYGLPRPDVGQRFPDQPGAAYAGFMTKENLPRGEGALRLQVTTDNGRTYFLPAEVTAKIKEGAFTAPRQAPEMWELPARVRPTANLATPAHVELGTTNILFVLYGDFTSNSAYHVTALANQLIERGYDCVVAVPEHAETIGAQPDARFLCIEYAELARLPCFYRDRKAPSLLHAWTTRESVRLFSQAVSQRFGSELVIHLEDNELVLLAHALRLPPEEILKLPSADLDRIVPPSLSHPERAAEFMAQARGITVITKKLARLVPSNQPHCCFWPAATAAFCPQERNDALRQSWGIPLADKVIFYHGNVHESNWEEVRELYRAVQALNASGHPTWLVRTGRDAATFTREIAPLIANQLIELGFLKRAKDLPPLMSVADYFVQPGEPGAFNDYRFPSKLPEFFAIGRPVILPRSNLGHDLIHRQHALVLATANAATIAAAVRELNADPALVARLSRGALDFAAERFSWSASADTVLAFYQSHTSLPSPSDRQLAAAALLTRTISRQENRA